MGVVNKLNLDRVEDVCPETKVALVSLVEDYAELNTIMDVLSLSSFSSHKHQQIRRQKQPRLLSASNAYDDD